jgi:hypothetical protein
MIRKHIYVLNIIVLLHVDHIIEHSVGFGDGQLIFIYIFPKSVQILGLWFQLFSKTFIIFDKL